MTKSAMITVCGRPNVGKSTLTNALVGEKIAIVSNKPQTTRNRIIGIVSHGDTQLVLLDTPGFIRPRNRLGEYMVNVVQESVTDVDAVLFLVEPLPEAGPGEVALIERFRESGVPVVLVINKIDTVEVPQLLKVIAAYSALYDFEAVIPVSAKTGDGLPELLAEMDHPFDKQETKATLNIAIRDVLWSELPDSYSDESINQYRDAVFTYFNQHYGDVA